MKDFAPTGTPAAPPLAPAPPAQAQPPLQQILEEKPSFEPSIHRFGWEDGEGVGYTIPAHLVEGIGIPEDQLAFELRQITIAEMCRSMRLAVQGDAVDQEDLQRNQVRSCIRRIGALEGAKLGDKELDAWMNAIGFQGYFYVKRAVDVLNSPLRTSSIKFEASKRSDLSRRRYSFTLPPEIVPRKRWARWTGLDARFVVDIDKETKVDKSRWTVGGAPADSAQQAILARDLSFTMQALTVEQINSVADMLEDPDDRHATRVVETMLSIVELGGVPIGNSEPELARKLAWMEAMGPRARQLVTGMFGKLHEIDFVDLGRFLDAAVPLD